MRFIKHAILCACLSCCWTHSPAANLLWEREIADRISAEVDADEAVWLGQSPERYLALHLLSATTATRGGVILLHDTGGNPDNKPLLHRLRIGLSKQGWETLSIQLPLGSRQGVAGEHPDLITQAIPRIQGAVDFFTARQIRNLSLLGHGLGADMGLAYLSERPAAEIRALVAIVPETEDLPDKTRLPTGAAKTPVLELLGSRGRETVRRNARLRKASARRFGWIEYRQDIVSGADHDFRGLEQDLRFRVSAWLRKVATGMKTPGR